MPDFVITMPAAELEKRHKGGSRYRLVAMNDWQPPKVDGRWPLILDVESTADQGPPLVCVEIETDTEWHGAPPADPVKVIPINPQQAVQQRSGNALAHA